MFVLARAIFVFVYRLQVYVLLCIFAFGSQYQSNKLPGKDGLRNDL